MSTNSPTSPTIYQEDVLSPRRSPMHVARVKRSHRFDTPFKSVDILVTEGGDFVHPRGLSINQPLIHVIIGRSAYTMKTPSTASGAKFTYNAEQTFPYNGEPRVRLLVTDGGSHIGFYDFNMTLPEFKKTWKKKVALHGRKGISGWLRVTSTPSNNLVPPPPSIQINFEDDFSMGSSPASGSTTPPPPSVSPPPVKSPQAKPQESTAIASSTSSSASSTSSDDDDDTPSGKLSSFGSVHVKLIRVEDLTHLKDGAFAEKPYIMAKLGKHKLRSGNGTSDGVLGDTLVFPYQQMRNLRLAVHDDQKMRKDPKLGFTTVDLDPYLHQGPQKVTLPLEHNKSSQGVVQVIIEFLNKAEPEARILATDLNVSQINAYSESDSSSEVSVATSAGMNKTSKINLKAKSVRIRVLRASDLSSGTAKPDASIHAYVKARVGSKWLKAKSDKAGGPNPAFQEQMVFPYDQQQHIKLVVANDMKARRDPTIGTVKIDMDSVLDKPLDQPNPVQLTLTDAKGAKAGVIMATVELCTNTVKKAFVESFTKASHREDFEDSGARDVGLSPGNKTLLCTPLSASDLPPARKLDTLDPYVVVRYGDVELVGPVASDAGPNPSFHSTFHFPGTPHRDLRIAVFDRAHLIKDSLVGHGVVDLSSTVPPSTGDPKTISLKLRDGKGKPAGKLNLRLEWNELSSALGVWTDDAAFMDKEEIQVFTPREETPSHIKNHSVKSFRVKAEVGENIPAAAKHPVYLRVSHGQNDIKGDFAEEKSLRPVFNDEFVVPYQGERFAKIGVYQSSHVSKNVVVGEGSIDLDQFLGHVATTETILVPLLDKKEKPAGVLKVFLTTSSAPETHARLLKHVAETSAGPTGKTRWTALMIDAKQGHDLVNPKGSRSDLLDPFIVMCYGDEKLRGKTHKNAGSNPTFVDTFCFPYQSRTKLNVEVFDHESLARDVCIGTAVLDLADLAQDSSETIVSQERKLDLSLNGQTTGTLACVVRLTGTEAFKKPVLRVHEASEDIYIESEDDVELLSKSQGPLGFNSFTLQLVDGQNLTNTNKLDKLDPYVIATYGESKLKTKEYHNAGNNPKFDQGFAFPRADYRHLKLEVYNKNSVFKDTFVGSGRVDLDSFNTVLQTDRPLSIPLQDKRGKSAGTLNCLLTTSNNASSTPQVVARRVEGRAAEPDSGLSTKSYENKAAPASIENDAPTSSPHKSVDIEIVKLSGLRSPKASTDTLDPYVVMKLGDDQLTGTTQKDGGASCAVGDVFHFPYRGNSNLRLEVFEKARMARDPLLGAAKVNLDNFVGTSHKLKIPLLTREGEPDAGFAFVKLSLNPHLGEAKPMVSTAPKKSVTSPDERVEAAIETRREVAHEVSSIDAEESSHGETRSAILDSGIHSIRVQLIHCQGLSCTNGKDLNPYVLGRLGRKTLRSETVKKSDGDACWDEDFVFPYSGHRKLKLLLRNNISMARDKTLGYAKIDLDQFLRQSTLHSYTCQLFNPATDEPNGELAIRVMPSRSPIEKAVVEDRGDVVSSASSLERTLPAASYMSKSVHLDRLRLSEVSAPSAHFDTINPYLEVRYGKKHLRSTTCKGFSTVAEYHERHSFTTTSASLVRIKVMNNERFALDRALGKGSINVAELAKQGESTVPFKVTLVDGEGRKTGVLEGSVIYDDVEVKKGAAVVKRVAPKAESSRGNAARPKGPLAHIKRELNKEGGGSSYSVSDAESAASSAFSEDLKAPTNVITTMKSFILEILGGESLAKSRKNDVLQPFVQVAYGKDKLKTRTVVNGGENPLFGDKFIMPFSNKKFVMLTLKDNVKLARDVVVGRAKLNLEDHINKTDSSIIELIIKDRAGQASGLLRVRLIPSQSSVSKAEVESTVSAARKKKKNRSVDTASTQGETPSAVTKCPYKSVQIELVCASNLKNPKASMDTLDPYVVVRFGSSEVKGKVMKNGGDDPDFQDIFHMPYESKRSIRFQVFDKAHVTKDPLLGSAKVNLDTFVSSHSETNRLKLQLYDSKHQAAGFLNVKLNLLKASIAKASVTSKSAPVIIAKSVEVEVQEISNLVIEARGAPPSGAYTKVRFGDYKLNSASVNFQGAKAVVEQRMQFPRGGKLMTFEIRDVESQDYDTLIGSGFVDVSSFLEGEDSTKAYQIPMQNEEGKHMATMKIVLKKNSEKCKTPIMLSKHTPYTPTVVVKSSKSITSTESSESADDGKIDFDVPWRSIHVTIESARGLRSTQIFGGRMDPYIAARLGTMELKSDPLMNAGANADFMTTFSFAYCGESLLRLFVYDYEQWRKDSLSGVARVNIAPYARYEATADKTVPIEIQLERPGRKESRAGTLKATLKFTMDAVAVPVVTKVTVGGKHVSTIGDE